MLCSVLLSGVLLASPPPSQGRSGGSGKGEIGRAWGAAGTANGTLQPPVSSPSHAEMSHAEKGKLTLWPRNGLALGPPRGHSFHRAGHDTAFTLPEASWGPGDGSGVRYRLKSRCQPLSSLVFLVELSILSLSFLVCKMETLIPASSGIGAMKRESVYKTSGQTTSLPCFSIPCLTIINT